LLDYAQLSKNLRRFYDFSGKIVLVVGAGGGQLLHHDSKAKKLIAIDRDSEALGELEARIDANGARDSMELVCASFEDVRLSGDVVYFEFCLHEISDPHHALTHARTLAPDIIVFDHLPASPWAFHAAEEDKVGRSTEAMERFGVRQRQSFSTEQRFSHYDELLAKVRVQGPVAIERAQRFIGVTNIVIPMSYGLALL
jgi:SAM-dependent methyltransferase